MIDPKQLRIGNYLKSTISGETLTIIMVASDRMQAERRIDGVLQEGLSEKFLSPIPITPEWLERLGFEKMPFVLSGCDVYQIGDYRVSMHRHHKDFMVSRDVMGSHFLTRIEHIHQLQNLYHALTGEELIDKIIAQ